MAIGGAFLGGGVEVVPAGSCKLELEILTEDRANLTATFTIKGTSTYTVTAGADGRAAYTVPAGQTYTVSVDTTGYDNIASQTVIAESGTVRYVRFEAFSGRVKRTGDTMTGNLTINNGLFINRKTTLESNNSATTVTEVGRVQFRSASDETANLISISSPSNNSAYLRSARNVEGKNVNADIIAIVGANGDRYGVAPSWSVGTNDNSDKILTIKMANSLPSLIHTTGNETKTGTLTLTSKLYANGDMDMWSSLVIGTAPSSTLKKTIAIKDSAGAWYGEISSAVQSNKTTSMFLRTRKWDSSVNTFADLGINILADGTAYASAPTTPSGATGKEITTANWSLGKFVQKSGDTMTGNLVRKSTQYENNDFAQTRHVLGEYDFDDKNGVFSGYLRRVGTTATQFTQIGCVANINGATVSSSVEAHILPDGATYATAPSWSVGTNDNSDKILTIKMANSLPSLVHTTGNESIAGDKIFSGLLQISNAISFKGNDTYPDFRIRRSGTNAVNLSLFIGGDATKPAITVSSSGNSIAIGSDSVKAYGAATPSDATGNEIATANWANSKFQRKITYGTGDPPSGGQAGDIYIKI